MIKAILFDNDGVLVNFPQIMWKARSKFIEDKYGKSLNNDDMKMLLGFTLDDQVNYLRTKLSINVTSNELHEHLTNVVKPMLEKDLALMPGVKNLLQDLKKTEH